MDEVDDSFKGLTGRLKAEHESASEELFLRYTHRLVGLARKHLGANLAPKLDAKDITQSVWKSFFGGYREGQYDWVEDWNGLWRLLAGITVNKCRKKGERFHTEGRDVRREINFGHAASESGAVWEALSPDPTASEAAMLRELIAMILGELKPLDCQVVELALDGHSVDAIAEAIGRSDRKVQRVLKQVRERLKGMSDESR